MYVIVGLGNPGSKYDNTKHNVGFETIDYMARELSISVKKLKHKALIGEGNYKGEKIILVKPQTYMNLSGDSVMSICKYYDLAMENLIVIYDDIDIDLGAVRIRKKGSAGSHNGMKDIIYKLRADNFPRIRVGIGKSDKMPLKNYVLSGFTKSEIPDIEKAIITASDACLCAIEHDVDIAMNRYNKKKV